MRIVKTARINAPIERAWKIMGPNYARAGDWASSVYASGPRPEKPSIKGAPVYGRVCETSIGPATEALLEYDPENYKIVYDAHAEKMPGFVKGLKNSWQLTPDGPYGTNVHMTFEMNIAAPFNVLMGWMMRLQMGGLLGNAVEEFKHFVETGKPHPRKVKVDSSKEAIAARKAIA